VRMVQSTEKVSIVIPVYNAEKTIIDCIESVLAQQHKNIEIILIDDGSVDKSAELCVEYQEKYKDKIQYVRQVNSGPAAARNRGIEFSSGKYVAFVDADDRMFPDMISTMITKAEAHSAEMVICAYCLIENGTKTECHYHLPEGLYSEENVEKVLYSLMDDADQDIPPYSCVRLTKRSVFVDNNLYFQSGLIRSEDFHFWAKVHAQIKNVYLLSHTPLYQYIYNSASITHSYVKDYWQGVQFIYDDLSQILPDSSEYKIKLDVMLVKRSLIALNNAALCTSRLQAWKEVIEIVNNKQLNSVINSLAKTEVKRFASYRKCMSGYRKVFVVCKYIFENILNRK